MIKSREARLIAVVLDLLLPGMTGAAFLDRLRAMPQGKRISVIVWTIKDLSTPERRHLLTMSQAIVLKREAFLSSVPILIIDDNPLNSKLVKLLLVKNGYHVQIAGDAEQALDVLKTYAPKLILMDLQMPGMDGFELTRLLKRDPAMRDVIIIALTAYAMKGDKRRALEAGCDGYIAKPIDTRTLPQLISGYLSARNGGKG